jgi:hypothetical protein
MLQKCCECRERKMEQSKQNWNEVFMDEMKREREEKERERREKEERERKS